MERKFDLDERLINFASAIMDIVEGLPKSIAGKYISEQIIRCGSAPALQYAEAQAAESRADFSHKMKVALKELRETYNCLRLINKKNWIDPEILGPLLNENNQLIAIFFKSIDTTRKNSLAKKP
jgi:four helix bundle protein